MNRFAQRQTNFTINQKSWFDGFLLIFSLLIFFSTLFLYSFYRKQTMRRFSWVFGFLAFFWKCYVYNDFVVISPFKLSIIKEIFPTTMKPVKIELFELTNHDFHSTVLKRVVFEKNIYNNFLAFLSFFIFWV